jgi:hypothetical protein
LQVRFCGYSGDLRTIMPCHESCEGGGVYVSLSIDVDNSRTLITCNRSLQHRYIFRRNPLRYGALCPPSCSYLTSARILCSYVTFRLVFPSEGSCYHDLLEKILRKIYYRAPRVLTKNLFAFIIDNTSYYDTTDYKVWFRFYAFLFNIVVSREGDKMWNWRFLI